MQRDLMVTAARLADALHGRAAAFRSFAFRQPEAELGQCRSCHAPVFWGRLCGSAHPFDLDGESHFSTCPDAERWRRDAEKKRIAKMNQLSILDAIDKAKGEK